MVPLLLAVGAVAVAALAVGPFVYRTLLPGRPGGAPTGGCFGLVTGGLFVLFVAAAIWWMRRR